jgi:hypothetical protein
MTSVRMAYITRSKSRAKRKGICEAKIEPIQTEVL